MDEASHLRLLAGGAEGEVEHQRELGQLVFGGGLVEIPEFFTVVRDGVVIGTVTAQFDFEELPPEWHQSALHWLLQNRVRLGALSGNDTEETPLPTEGGVIRRIRTWLGMS